MQIGMNLFNVSRDILPEGSIWLKFDIFSSAVVLKNEQANDKMFYYIPLNYTSLELSVSFKRRLKSVSCFRGDPRKVIFKYGTRDGKHDAMTS